MIAKYVENMALTGLPDLWASDTLKCALITTATTPSITDSDPRWGAGGSQNYSTNEVTPGGTYTAGGFTLTGNSVTQSGAVTSLNATSPVSWAANASNPTNARWAIIYDSSDAGLRVLAFIDLGAVTSLVSGLQINLNGVSSGTQPVLQGTAT
jgi:hypothetical protein